MNKSKVAIPATMWTDLVQWREAAPEARRMTLERFYSQYRLPLITFLRKLGYNLQDAEDILQEFILAQVEGGILLSADPRKGRFRNLLLTSLKRFAASWRRKFYAGKRQPKGGIQSLQENSIEGQVLKYFNDSSCGPDEVFHRTWLLSVLVRVSFRLREEFEAKNQIRHWFIFNRRIFDPIMNGDKVQSIGQLAEDLGISPEEASNHLVTAKRAYRRLLKLEVQDYLGTEKEVTEEINEFFYFLANLNH